MSILDLNMGINAGPYFNHLTDNYDYGVKKEMSPAPALSGSNRASDVLRSFEIKLEFFGMCETIVALTRGSTSRRISHFWRINI